MAKESPTDRDWLGQVAAEGDLDIDDLEGFTEPQVRALVAGADHVRDDMTHEAQEDDSPRCQGSEAEARVYALRAARVAVTAAVAGLRVGQGDANARRFEAAVRRAADGLPWQERPRRDRPNLGRVAGALRRYLEAESPLGEELVALLYHHGVAGLSGHDLYALYDEVAVLEERCGWLKGVLLARWRRDRSRAAIPQNREPCVGPDPAGA
jgi:hypothetical protein